MYQQQCKIPDDGRMEGGRQGGKGSGSIRLFGLRFIYNAERPGERMYLCGKNFKARVAVCVYTG